MKALTQWVSRIRRPTSDPCARLQLETNLSVYPIGDIFGQGSTMDAVVAHTDLLALEEAISSGVKGFLKIGEALREIRDRKLYTDEYDTFEEYVEGRWGWGRAHAYRLMEASSVVAALPPGEKPTVEAQARELTKVPEPKRAKVWKEAVETAPRDKKGKPRVTAQHVRETAVRQGVLKTNADGSIDKLGSMRAAREARTTGRNGKDPLLEFRHWVMKRPNRPHLQGLDEETAGDIRTVYEITKRYGI